VAATLIGAFEKTNIKKVPAILRFVGTGFPALSPLAKGLFRHAIAERHARDPRDPELRYLSVSYRQLKAAEEAGTRFAESKDVRDLAALRAVPWQRIVEGSNTGALVCGSGTAQTAASVDPAQITQQEALALAQAAIQACKAQGMSVNAQVADADGHLRVALASENATLASLITAPQKIASVLAFHASTRDLQTRVASDPAASYTTTPAPFLSSTTCSNRSR
jgi:hypothetical protein